jgi:signal transduction histidine kinase
VPPDLAARVAQVLPNPIPAILGYREALHLTGEQVARIQAISDSLDVAIRNVSDSLQAESRRAGGRVDPTALYDRLRVRLAEGRRHIRHALEAAQGVLTPRQWARLPDAVKTPAPR